VIAVQGPTTGIDVIAPEVWFAAAKWAADNQLLTPVQRRIAYSLGKVAARKGQPSEKQDAAGRKLLLEAVRLGFTHDQLSERHIETLPSPGPGR
jgi:hypothetical protein